MIVIRALVTPFIIAAVLLCCCGPAAELVPVLLERERVHIVGGYSIGRELGCGLELYRPPYDRQDGTGRLGYLAGVGPSVVKIGWDKEFILVEQHFLDHCIGDRPNTDPRWHIIVVSTGKHYSWRSYDNFVSLRDEVLHVPDTIEMRNARDVYYDR